MKALTLATALVAAGLLATTSAVGCAGAPSPPPEHLKTAAPPVAPVALSDECRGTGYSFLDHAPAPPADPHGVLGQSWPTGDSCALASSMLRIHDADAFFSVPANPGRKLHNAAWVGRELEKAAGGLLHVRIPEGMGVTTRTASAALAEASEAVRDAKEQMTGIAATVAATAYAWAGDGDEQMDDSSVTLHRKRVLTIREGLDARLRDIGTAVLRDLVPGGQAGRESYLVWGDATSGRITPFDAKGYELAWRTHERVSGGPLVTMPPVETL